MNEFDENRDGRIEMQEVSTSTYYLAIRSHLPQTSSDNSPQNKSMFLNEVGAETPFDSP